MDFGTQIIKAKYSELKAVVNRSKKIFLIYHKNSKLK